MNNKIIRIELTPIHVPFKEPVRKMMSISESGVGMAIPIDEEWLGGDFVICKLIDDEGNIGLGEAFVWLPETGVSPEQIIDSIQKSLYRYTIGESPFNVEKMLFKMNNNVSRNEVAKGLIDMACYDLMGKITNQPAHNLMGGKAIDEIPLCALIPLAEISLMKGITKSYLRKGFRTIRIKLGNSINEDVEITEIIRETIGPDIRLRVDYNQAYTPSTAVRAIDAIEIYGIDVAEQPVNKDDYMGMAYVQDRVNVPLMAHEGCFSLRDIITLVELGAVETVGINSERPGGVTQALKAVNYARQNGLGVVIHNQPLGIATAMHIHFAAAMYNSLGHAVELFGAEMMSDDLIKQSIDYSGGTARIPEGPGWGVDLDEKALEKHATSQTILIKK